MLSLRVLNEIIEKNRAWILVLWCWFVWNIFGGHLGQKTKLLKRFMHESPQRNYWKESCMNLSFVMLIFLEDIWRAFGTKNKIVEKIHAWILVFQSFWRGLDERRIRFGGGSGKVFGIQNQCFRSHFANWNRPHVGSINSHKTPNASLQQLSRPTMPFRLMAVLHCLRTRELLVKLLRIRWLGQPMAENRDVLAKK